MKKITFAGILAATVVITIAVTLSVAGSVIGQEKNDTLFVPQEAGVAEEVRADRITALEDTEVGNDLHVSRNARVDGQMHAASVKADGDAEVGGQMRAAMVRADGDASVGGKMRAASVQSDGDADVAGRMKANMLEATGSASIAQDLSVTGNLNAKVDSADIVDGTIQAQDLAPITIESMGGMVDSARIVDGTIQAQDLAPSFLQSMPPPPAGSITTLLIADNAVTTPKIAPLSITPDRLRELSVTTAKLADLSVTTSKLADSAVTTPKIMNGAINTDKIANSAVTDAKLMGNAIPVDARNSGTTSTSISLVDNRAGSAQAVIIIVTADITNMDAAADNITITAMPGNGESGTLTAPDRFTYDLPASKRSSFTAVFFVSGAGDGSTDANAQFDVSANLSGQDAADVINSLKVVAFALPY